jgi:hypothetical protein
VNRPRIDLWTALFGLGVALGASTSAARGETAGFRSPETGAQLAAGSTARVLWDAPPKSGSSTEGELVLSLDGGRTFPIRVTRDFSPATGAVLWRVPRLPTRAARLALRLGEDEEPAEETTALVSGEFEIVGDEAGAPMLEPLFPARGEWRTEDASEASSNAPLPGELVPESPEGVRALPERDTAAESPREPASVPRDTSSPSREKAPLSMAAPPPPPSTCPSRLIYPLRP